jgi:phosphoribosylanthranilate isomerase
MVKVKICGITNAGDALASAKAGCDALGFIFYKKSPRYITPEAAKTIIRHLPRGVATIGVFVNARETQIRQTIRLCGLDMIQLHGSESPKFCRRFKGCRVIKAFRVKSAADIEKAKSYDTFAYLFDSYSRGTKGGTGKSFDWNLLTRVRGLKRNIFLSGGLDERNVARALELTGAPWVDASSSLEERPGKKDPLKVERFIKKVKEA